jgi:phosphate transport system permease protein
VRRRLAFKHVVNYLILGLTGVCALVTISVLFFILGYLVYNGAASLRWSFFTNLPVPVGETGGGIANGLVGSGKMLLLATCIGIPIGFLGGVFLSEYGHPMSSFVIRYVTDLLNGVPSIVIGIVAWVLVVRPMGHFSTFAGGVALGIMMIPISVRSTEEFLHAVPQSLREAALALGAPKWKAIVTVVVPAAIRGIISGTMLDLARVAGETAPLMFTALGSAYWSPGWNQPTAALPLLIFNYAISPYEDWHRQAWAGGFVLLTAVLLVNIFARMTMARGIHIPR